MPTLPRISVVTPSYNQADYIEATLRSVHGQDYPNLEHIVIDGGSNDGSADIIERWADRLDYWVSEPDNGQSDAINKGFERATGDILCWLNSDDLFMPGALHRVAEYFTAEPDVGLLSGAWVNYRDPDSFFGCPGCGGLFRPTMSTMLAFDAVMPQHATFWTRQTWNECGPLNISLHMAMDHDFFTRCFSKGVKLKKVPDMLAAFRQHNEQKTASFVKYHEESLALRSAYLQRPEWAGLIGRTRIAYQGVIRGVSKWLLKRPRLSRSFVPQLDREWAAMWFAMCEGKQV